ncbi:hypothetical protein M433DRAFT_223908 [Acidomyces richmondensis BFW]|nr:hypothetical protein M433DRAFT_223908 [Acidomyces richmondensis BFW]
MKPISSSQRPPADPELSSPRKRKRSSNHSSPEESNKQKTVQNMLSSHKDLNSSSTRSTLRSKRQKADHPISTLSAPFEGLSRSEMYNFSSQSSMSQGNTVVDLTSGISTPSSQTRKINGTVKGRLDINPHTGAKKLVVKNLQKSTQWDSKVVFGKDLGAIGCRFGNHIQGWTRCVQQGVFVHRCRERLSARRGVNVVRTA